MAGQGAYAGNTGWGGAFGVERARDSYELPTRMLKLNSKHTECSIKSPLDFSVPCLGSLIK